MKISTNNIYDNCGCLLGTIVIILCIALILGVAFGLLCFQGWIFMLLWNWLAVSLFNAPALGYWVCVGIVLTLNFLGRLIFGHKD
jgi:uncharacterized membrane protein YkgB